MIEPLVSFSFDNFQFDVIERSDNQVYVKLHREMIYSANGPRPVLPGCMFGYRTKIKILYHGKADDRIVWQMLGGSVAAIGYLEDDVIPLPMCEDEPKKYTINIYYAKPGDQLKSGIMYSNVVDKHVQNAVLLLSIRHYIIERLSELMSDAVVKYGSGHVDNSGNNDKYQKSIRVDALDRPLCHIYLYYQSGFYAQIFKFVGPHEPISMDILPLDLDDVERMVALIKDMIDKLLH